MVDQVEKVARALHDAEPPTYSDSFPPVVIPFDALSPKRRERIDRLAAAVLTAYNPNERLREALEFYAREWKANGDGDCDTPGLSRSWMEPTDELYSDEGRRAREALARASPSGLRE